MGKFIKLGSLVNIRTGKLNANAANENGCYPFFTCSIEPLTINTYAYDCESVLLAGNGDLNVKYYNGKFNAYQRTYIIESKDKDILSVRFLYYFLCEYIDTLRNNSIGGVIKYIKLSDLTEINFPLIPTKDQQRIVNILDKADEIRTKKKLANEKLDEFLKSTFIDMFDDPVTNPKNWSVYTIKEVAEKDKNAIKAGPFGSALKKEYYTDSGYKIYGQEQVISGDINYGDYYIDEKIFNKLRNCEIKENDVLISLVGSYGRILIVPKEFQKGIINPRLMKITFDKSKINTLFFKYFFSSESLQKLLCDNTHGGTMGILNTSIVKALKIIVPPIDLQNQFAQIVQKVEAQKEKNQKVIEQMDNLFNSLMQQAFKGEL